MYYSEIKQLISNKKASGHKTINEIDLFIKTVKFWFIDSILIGFLWFAFFSLNFGIKTFRVHNIA